MPTFNRKKQLCVSALLHPRGKNKTTFQLFEKIHTRMHTARSLSSVRFVNFPIHPKLPSSTAPHPTCYAVHHQDELPHHINRNQQQAKRPMAPPPLKYRNSKQGRKESYRPPCLYVYIYDTALTVISRRNSIIYFLTVALGLYSV